MWWFANNHWFGFRINMKIIIFMYIINIPYFKYLVYMLNMIFLIIFQNVRNFRIISRVPPKYGAQWVPSCKYIEYDLYISNNMIYMISE